MNLIISWLLIFVSIAFIATIMSIFIKLILFLNQKDTYRHILKFGILGELIGMLIMSSVWVIYRREIINWNNYEIVISIPFYFMLTGLLTGILITYNK